MPEAQDTSKLMGAWQEADPSTPSWMEAGCAFERMWPGIQALVRSSLIGGSIGSLLVWGCINLGMWYFFWRSDQSASQTLLATVLANFAGIVGGCQILFALVGLFSGSAISVIADSGLLFAVGAWNGKILLDAGSDFKWKYPLFFLVGSQLACGVWRLKRLVHLLSLPRGRIEPSDAVRIRQEIDKLSKMEVASPASGVLHASKELGEIERGPGSNKTARDFVGRICQDRIIMVCVDVDECLSIRKDQVRTEIASRGVRGLEFDSVSRLVLKAWAGVKIEPFDIKRLKATRRASLSILRPFLQCGDVGLRAAAEEALAEGEKDGTKSGGDQTPTPGGEQKRS